MEKQGRGALGFGDVLERLWEQAGEFSGREGLFRTFDEATRDPQVWAEATADPRSFLEQKGYSIPAGLDVAFFEHSPGGGSQRLIPRCSRSG